MYNEIRSSGLNDLGAPLERVVRKDLRHHYAGPICACRWISLCNDPSYGHKRLVTLIEAVLPDLILALKADAEGLAGVDLVSLGPGNGSIDLRILHGLQSRLQLGCYYCVDSSFELLCHAVGRALQDKNLRNLKIRAICGDFAEARSLCLPEGSDGFARLFTLTGFTLGNFTEDELIPQISQLISKQDYLLLDARLHHLAGWDGRRKLRMCEISTLLGHYQPDSVKRFVFGPVEALTLANASDVPIDYEVATKKSTVPRAAEIVIFCRSLDTIMRLTGRRIRKQRLDLASTTLYGYSDLCGWLESEGFRLVWRRKMESVGFFLLRKNH